MSNKAAENPLVSVIMPAYNAAATLEEAVNSILLQTYENWELLLLIEPSTDNSLQIAQRLSALDDRIRLFSNEKQLGIAANRNKGLREARGELVAVLDADDLALPTRLEKQVKFLVSHPDIFLVGSGIIRIDWDGAVQREICQDKLTHHEIIEALPKGNQFTHSTIMSKNTDSLHYREKIFYGEDYDLFLRLVTDGYLLANIAEPLVKYRTSLSSVTFTEYSWEIQKQMLELIRIWYQERIEKGSDSYDSFEPKIFKKLAESLLPAELSWQTIRTALRANHSSAVRIESTQYLKKYGFNYKVFAALLYSFLPRKLVNLLKRITKKEY